MQKCIFLHQCIIYIHSVHIKAVLKCRTGQAEYQWKTVCWIHSQSGCLELCVTEKCLFFKGVEKLSFYWPNLFLKDIRCNILPPQTAKKYTALITLSQTWYLNDPESCSVLLILNLPVLKSFPNCTTFSERACAIDCVPLHGSCLYQYTVYVGWAGKVTRVKYYCGFPSHLH